MCNNFLIWAKSSGIGCFKIFFILLAMAAILFSTAEPFGKFRKRA